MKRRWSFKGFFFEFTSLCQTAPDRSVHGSGSDRGSILKRDNRIAGVAKQKPTHISRIGISRLCADVQKARLQNLHVRRQLNVVVKAASHLGLLLPSGTTPSARENRARRIEIACLSMDESFDKARQ